ncbi:hypothetical protein Hte_007577 [Hypoxylon texense]
MATQYEKPSAETEDGPERTTQGDDPAQAKGEAHTSSNQTFGKESIYLKDPTGRKFQFPFKMARTWHGMKGLIEQASNHIDTIGPLIKAGHYDLIGPDGNAILPSVWEACIEPGWFITMQLWKDAEDAQKQAEEAFKKNAFDEAKLKAEELLKKNQGKDQAPIRFKDAVGRKFSFPFHLCKTWMGMEDLIKQAFLHVDVIGPHVQAGHYDLVGPSGEIILPQVWEKVVEPDWVVTMHMWPMDRPPAPRPRPPGMQYPPYPGPGTAQPPPPPPPPPPPQFPYGFQGVRDSQTIAIAPEVSAKRPKKPSKRAGGILGWMGGGQPRGNPRKQKLHAVQRITKANLPVIPPLRTNTAFSGPKSATDNSSNSTTASDDSGSEDQSKSIHSFEELGARQQARQKQLIVVCKPDSSSSIHYQAIRRQTVPFLESPTAVPKRLEISSARVYSESPWTFQSSLELIRRSKTSPPSRSQPAQSERAPLTWL